MRLVPIVVLIEQTDLDTLTPAIERIADNFDPLWIPDGTAALMRTNGWTPAMLAWSIILRGIADTHRQGLLDFEITPYNTDTPTVDEHT